MPEKTNLLHKSLPVIKIFGITLDTLQPNTTLSLEIRISQACPSQLLEQPPAVFYNYWLIFMVLGWHLSLPTTQTLRGCPHRGRLRDQQRLSLQLLHLAGLLPFDAVRVRIWDKVGRITYRTMESRNWSPSRKKVQRNTNCIFSYVREGGTHPYRPVMLSVDRIIPKALFRHLAMK